MNYLSELYVCKIVIILELNMQGYNLIDLVIILNIFYSGWKEWVCKKKFIFKGIVKCSKSQEYTRVKKYYI